MKALPCQWNPPLLETVKVGDLLTLQCQIKDPKALERFKADLKDKPQSLKFSGMTREQKYELVLLKPLGFKEVSPAEAEAKAEQLLLQVTSYKVGSHTFSHLQLSNGKTQWPLAPFQLQVSSVLKPGQKVQPHPFQGPFHLPWPWELTFFITGIGLVLLFFFSFRIGKKLRRRHWKQNMVMYDSHLSPAQELGKNLRRLQGRFSLLFSQYQGTSGEEEALLKGDRKILFMEEFHKVFRRFLLRILKIPPLIQWKEKQVLKEAKRQFVKKKKQPFIYESFQLIFSEMERISQMESLPLREIRLLCHLLHKTAYEVERAMQ